MHTKPIQLVDSRYVFFQPFIGSIRILHGQAFSSCSKSRSVRRTRSSSTASCFSTAGIAGKSQKPLW